MHTDRDDRPRDHQTAGSHDGLGGAPTLLPSEDRGSAATLVGGSEVERRAARDRAPGPQQLGRYVVLGTLGQGGMGTVLKAYDEALDRAIAIKLLHPEAAERHAKRLEREAQALAKLSHPNVVQVYEVGEDQGQRFIAMELVRGQTLGRWQAQERSWQERVKVYLQAGEGLAAAHAVGLVHRDFKPDNCIIDAQGRPRVLDFGLVRETDVPSEDASGAETEVGDEGVDPTSTRAGTILGTLAYMPLEQLEGKPADARSDQFSFCVSLYEAVYGERPFSEASVGPLVLALMKGEVQPPPKGSRVPTKLRRVLLRGLAARPEERWASMTALLAELRALVVPRGRRWMALGVTGGLLVIGAGLVRWAELDHQAELARQAERCSGARAQLRGIWDDGRRQHVEDAILGTMLSYAPDTWARVHVRLDEYSESWIDAHTETCEATSVRAEQSSEVMDLRMACLRERKVALREAVDVLAEADATRVEKAVTLVTGLPGLSRCDDVEALRAELPPPEDLRVAEQVEALRERLQRARGLTMAAQYDEALLEVEAVMEQSVALEYGPLHAEALQARGAVLDLLARTPEGEHDLEQAYLLAVEHGHERVEKAALIDLVHLVGVTQARHEAALQWGKTALALAKSPHAEPLDEAEALDDLGLVLREQGKLSEALAHHQRALAIVEGALGPSHLDVAGVLNNIGLVLDDQGRLPEALTHYQRSLATLEDALGPRHPNVAQLLNNIGIVLWRQGKLPEALDHHQRALTIREDALGPRHPKVAQSLANIGSVLGTQGRLDEELAHYRRALEISEEALGRRHPRVAQLLNNIGAVLMDQGELEPALTYHRQTLEIREEVLGPRHHEVADSLTNIGKVLMEQGELADSLSHHRRALEIRQEALGARHLAVAESLHDMGDVLRRQGSLAEALSEYQRALEIREEAFDARHPRIGSVLLDMAEVELARRNPEAAREPAQRAISIFEADESSAELLPRARFVLAQALWGDRSQRARAHALAEQARDAYAEAGEGKATALAEVQRWLGEHPVP